MKSRVESLLRNPHFEILCRQKEFFDGRYKVLCMLERLIKGVPLLQRQIDFIEYAEKHLKNIDPHLVKMTVNGEEAEVYFETNGFEKKEEKP